MSEARHAYLILAHHRPDLLQELISALDDPRNDIFVHIDAKAGPDMDPGVFAAAHATLTFTERISVNWAGYSQVDATYILLEAALASGPHERYHLMTGASFPLRGQDEIFAWCADHPDCEFIELAERFDEGRVQHYHLFNELGKYDRNRSIPERAAHILLSWTKDLFLALQSSLGIRRAERLGIELRKGLAYWSLTQEAAAYVCGKRELADRLFRHAHAPDEFFVQTLLANGPLADRLEGSAKHGSLRWTTWEAENGDPTIRPGHNLMMADLAPMLASGCFFALKFEGPDGPALIEAVKASMDA